MVTRYSRQELVRNIGKEGQRKISQNSVVLIGCGALGTHVANILVRAGIRKLTIIDRDFIEIHNLQRQILFNEEDIVNGLPKAVAAKNHLEKINSEVEIKPIVTDVNFTNIENLLEDSNVVIDGTDNFSTRYLINEACDKLSIPWVYGSGIATGGMSMTIIPGRSPCFACQFPEQPPIEFALSCDTAGVLSTAISISASIQSTEVLKILLGKFEELNKCLIEFDVWNLTFNKFEIRKNLSCTICSKKEYKLLNGNKGLSISTLCGQNAIQLIDLGAEPPDFILLEKRIGDFTEVRANKFMLKFSLDNKEATVFNDGRTIIKGVSNELEAKSFYNKYIGG